MTLLQTLLHITNFKGGPVLSNVAPAVGAAVAVQLAVGIPSAVCVTDLLYDFSGGFTFLLTLASSILLPALRRGVVSRIATQADLAAVVAGANWRQLALTGGTLLYAMRLSTFLFARILKKGHDSRFDTTKHNPRRFLVFWIAQAVWVAMCSMPAITVNAIHPAAFKAGLGVPEVLPTDVVGFSLFVVGLLVEIVADYQKTVWSNQKAKKVHDELFITRGLWGRSRYPNYFGDITLWTGMAIVAAGVLKRGPVQASLGWHGVSGLLKAFVLPGLAPAFVSWALLRLSGVPLSEKKYDKLYGHRKDYQEWRNKTPKLVPRIF